MTTANGTRAATVGGSNNHVMAPSGPGLPSATDPRVTALLRWSAGLSGPLIICLLAGVGGLLVTLRDESREMKLEIRQIVTSNTEQENEIEELTRRQDEYRMKTAEHGLRLRAIESRVGLR